MSDSSDSSDTSSSRTSAGATRKKSSSSGVCVLNPTNNTFLYYENKISRTAPVAVFTKLPGGYCRRVRCRTSVRDLLIKESTNGIRGKALFLWFMRGYFRVVMTQIEQGGSSSTRSTGDSSPRPWTRDFLEITVKSVMEGVPGARILVPPLCRVCELKSIVSDATDVQVDKMLLLYEDVELRDESALISSYGITKNCNLILNVKMSTGSKVARSHATMSALLMPFVMQQSSLPSIRNNLKQMTTVRSRPVHRKKIDISKEYSTVWTPAKQMEHELTRNRMRRLLRKRKKNTILADTPPKTTSPMSTESGPPPDSPSTSSDSKTSTTQNYESNLTEKQLKNFFEPCESAEQLQITSSTMAYPPENVKELLKLQAEERASRVNTCAFCKRKLALTEQHIHCLCEEKFCKKHRMPAAHHCSIDYKQTGRTKIYRDNPKISEGGYHKARQE